MRQHLEILERFTNDLEAARILQNIATRPEDKAGLKQIEELLTHRINLVASELPKPKSKKRLI